MRSGRALLGLDRSDTRRQTTVGVNQFSEDRASRLEVVLQPQHRQSDCFRIRPSQADDADAPAPRRGGDGDDSVVEVHRKIVAVLFSGTAIRQSMPYGRLRGAGLLAGL